MQPELEELLYFCLALTSHDDITTPIERIFNRPMSMDEASNTAHVPKIGHLTYGNA